MKINYFILNLSILITISTQSIKSFNQFSLSKIFYQNIGEYLVSSDFINPNSSNAPNWSLPNTLYYCSNTLYSDWSGQKYYTGVFENGQTQSKVLSSLPPHWTLSVRFDLLLSGCINSTKNDQFKILIDNSLVGSYTKQPSDGQQICVQNAAQGTCKDELVLFQKNITHTANSVTFTTQTISYQGRTFQGFAFKNFYLYVDTCDITCATCSGPTSNQCLTCPANSSLSSNTCTCNNGFIQHLYSCVSSCPTGFVKSNTRNICIQDFNLNCSSSNAATQQCVTCSSGYLYQGYCVDSCPKTSNLVSGVCVDFSTSLINGSYLLQGLFNNYFGQSEILGLGLVVSNFKGLLSSFGSTGALTTNCGTNHVLGGFWLSGSGATISRSWTGLGPHWSIRVGYTLWKIDQWNNQYFTVTVDGTAVQQIQYNLNVGTSDLCGFNNQLDQQSSQIANFTHSSTTFSLTFSTTLNDNVGTQSFAISNLYILVDYCTSNCISCGASGCLVCQQSYFLYNNVCVTSCPSSTFLSNPTTCVDCNSNCKTCNSPGNICTSCNSPNFLNPGNGLTCLPTCPVSYWQSSSDQTCKTCHTSCYTCISPETQILMNIGDQTSCKSCNGSLYLFNSQCISQCPSNTYYSTITDDNRCLPCNSSCLTCNGPNSDNCLSCSSPNYLQPLSNACVLNCNSNQYQDSQQLKCINCDQTCSTCSGPNNNQCLTCQGSGSLYLSQNFCVSDCPIGTYKNLSNNTCSPCNSQCASCFGGNSNNCSSCQGSLYLNEQSNTCVSSCPDGYFANSEGNKCSPCYSTCKTCSGANANNCKSCSETLYLSQNSCISDCPLGTYQNLSNNTCSPCDSSCSTCSGQQSNNCLSCSNSLYLYKSSNTCVSTCPQGTYSNSSGNICSPCHSTCATCTGPQIDNCLSCSGSLSYNQSIKTCTSNCPDGTYSSGGTCLNCNSSCSTCYGSETNNCLSCSGNLYFDKNNNSCTQNCPDKTYANTQNHTCSACDFSCAACFGPDSNNCQTCSGSLFFSTTSKTCISVCPKGTYANDQGNMCSACDQSCSSCSGSKINNCLSCPDGFYLNQLLNTCTSTCPDGTYSNSSNNTCSPCNSSCTTCSGSASICQSCYGSLYLDYNTNTCNSSCPQGTYQNNNNNICSVCDPSCKTCSGPNANNCINCQGTLYLDHNTLSCVSNCPPKTYANTQNNTCSTCDSSCQTCFGQSSNNCITCSNSLYLNQALNSCTETCPQGYYPEQSTNKCTQCDQSCSTCFGPSASNCLSCSGDLFLSSSGNECKNTCQTKEFQNKVNNQCTQCDSTCSTCNGSLSYDCLSCQSPLFLQKSSSTCISQCSSNQYGQTPSRLCQNCDQNCLTCSGPYSNNCLSCPNFYYLNSQTNECVASCPDGTYADSQSNKCIPCNSTCTTCSGASQDNCLSCSGNLYLNKLNNTCVLSCPGSYYPNTQNNQCSKCDITCATCYGGTNSNCLTCSNSLIYQQSTSQCINSCSNGYYLDVNTNTCSQCDSTCLTCIGGSKNQCLSCQSPRYYQNQTSVCTINCEPNQYSDTQTMKCQQCDSSCATCSGPNNNQCLSCSGSLYYIQSSGTCIQNCPNGYIKDAITNQCQKCDQTCQECSGTLNTQCTSCEPSLILFNNQCLSKCPFGFFISSNQCFSCDQSCESCNGLSSNNCLSCKSGSLLINNQCLNQCPDGYYQNNSQCLQCHPQCKTCSGPSQDQCETCVDLLIKYNSKCVAQCEKETYYVQSPYKQCFQCHYYCNSGCNGPLREDCLDIKLIYQYIVYIIFIKSFIWVVSIIVGFLKDQNQQTSLQQRLKVIPLSVKIENNKRADFKDQNQSNIKFDHNDQNLSPNNSKFQNLPIEQQNKTPRTPINQGSSTMLPQTNSNLVLNKTLLTFNNQLNEEGKTPDKNKLGAKRRARKIEFILRNNNQSISPPKVFPQTQINDRNSKIQNLDQKFFPQDQTTARSIYQQNSPGKNVTLSSQIDFNKAKYQADEKLKYSFVKLISNQNKYLSFFQKSNVMNGQIYLYFMIAYQVEHQEELQFISNI